MTDKNINENNGVELENRCRVILIAPTNGDVVANVEAALSGGDVASVIVPMGEMSETHYRVHAIKLVSIIQAAGAAAILVGDTQVLGRNEADGLFIASGPDNLIEALEKFSPKKIIGFGGVKDRHQAMMAGDIGPDFVFFGKLNGDIKPEPHHKNIALAEWWSQLISIPCVVMSGSDLNSVIEIAESRADFVALGSAVFDNDKGPKVAVSEANALLEKYAPSLLQDDE
ncbi:MAG: thiamine phosphate synthase [Rhizobiales bacterium]|nr:thiamine phosphate synthase [Hyphomicrobiales bacterium]